MPELPDVETFRRYLNANALHQRIQAVQVQDSAILDGVTASSLHTGLRGHELKSTHRHGKNLFVQITGCADWLRFHFGMTGSLAYSRESKPLRHARALFHFSNEHQLAYLDQRKLGAIGLTAAIDDYINQKRLGPDALQISESQFRARLQSHRSGVKSALMNQQIIAGIGNVYADELLYHALTHPKAPVQNLARNKLKRIYHAMQSVLKKAIQCRADIDSFPRNWMLPHRIRGGKCPRCGHGWKLSKVSGRTTFSCPRCQPS